MTTKRRLIGLVMAIVCLGAAGAERFMPERFGVEFGSYSPQRFKGGMLAETALYSTNEFGLHFIDVNTGSAVLLQAYGEEPFFGDLIAYPSFALLPTDREIWITDGTKAGTRALISFEDAYVSLVYPEGDDAGDFAYFTVGRFEEGETELWRTGGTAATTSLVYELEPVLGFGPPFFVQQGNKVYWIVSSFDGIALFDTLWVSEGTAETTRPLRTFPAQTIDRAHFAGAYIYLVLKGIEGAADLWRADGTVDGTIFLQNLWPSSSEFAEPRTRGVEVGNRLLLNVWCDLFTSECDGGRAILSDGSVAGTRDIALSGYDAWNWGAITAMSDTEVLVEAGDYEVGYDYFVLNPATGAARNIFGNRTLETGANFARMTSNVARWEDGYYFWLAGEIDGEEYNGVFRATTAANSAEYLGCPREAVSQPLWDLYPFEDAIYGMVGQFVYRLKKAEGDTCPMWNTVDSNEDYQVSLTEVLRAIQFYNSPGLSCVPMPGWTEDLFHPEIGDTDCAPHDLDNAPQDWQINVSEVLRAIQFYNSPGYRYCPGEGSEDGFCPL